VLRAYDEGALVSVDVAPIRSEMEMIAAGRRTFVYTLGGQLVERTWDRLRAGDNIRGTKHVEHACEARS